MRRLGVALAVGALALAASGVAHADPTPTPTPCTTPGYCTGWSQDEIHKAICDVWRNRYPKDCP